VAGQPWQIVTLPGVVTKLVVSGADLYLAISGGPSDRLVHLSTDGRCVETLLDAADVRELAVDARLVYFSEAPSSSRSASRTGKRRS
jgi:hypothetical protein